MPVYLPAAATTHMSDTAQQQLINSPSPFETYSTVNYTGTNGGVTFNGLLVEVDANTWVENDVFTFEEVSESDTQIVLYDASRATTIVVNLITNDLLVQFSGNELVWNVTGVTQSFTPTIPDGWII